MTLRELRRSYGLTQENAANIVCIPVRTYRRYESDEFYGSPIKRNAFKELLNNRCEITEEKGLLTIDEIKKKLTELFDNVYPGQIEFCYLFGSYSTGLAKEDSDVDLYVCSSLKGLTFVGLIENIRKSLHKRIDVIRGSELEGNVNLVNEILKYGIKIYG